MSESQRIRVLCVDDHRVVRDGLALIVGSQPDMELVGTAASVPEAIKLFEQLRPDITLMDLQLRAMSGVDAIIAIRTLDPQARIIVLTVHRGDEDIHRAMRAGASAYLLKDSLSDDLEAVIRTVHAGQQPAMAEAERELAQRATGLSLTAREIQVMELVSRGFRNKEISAALGISEDTAHAHIRNILSKLKVNDRTAAVTVALRRGIIRLLD